MYKRTLLIMPGVPYAINDWNLPPVGILYISSSMKQANLPVVNLNLNLEKGDLESTLQKVIIEKSIDIVAVGGLVVNYDPIKDIVDVAKRVNPKVITVIGGSFVTHSPIEAMKIVKNADFGIIGEGEITCVELTKAISTEGSFNNIPGLIFRSELDGNLVITKKRQEITDLDLLPWPDYEGFNYFKVTNGLNSSNKLTAPITTSRSCPYKCTFCSSSGGEHYRKRSIENVVAEIDYLIEEYGITEFFLNDELFANQTERVDQFCEDIASRDVSWHIMLRADKNITQELLVKMKNAGCLGICYGMESADNSILRNMRKGITIEDIYRAVKMTHQENLTIRGGFIFGDPCETNETVEKTLSWIESNIDILGNISISPIILYPGSFLYKKAILEKKITNPQNYITDGCKPVNITKMTDQDYYRLINKTLPEFSSKIRYRKSMITKMELKEKIYVKNKVDHYFHEFICKNCGTRVVHHLYPNSLFQSHICCDQCGQNYDFTPSFLFFEEFDEKITLFLKKQNHAIWGAGETLANLYQCNEYLRNNEVVIIDLDINKQKTGFFNKQVYGLDIIKENKITDVLCCVGNASYFSIEDTVLKQLDNINLIWINQIGFTK